MCIDFCFPVPREGAGL
uniref:Uncharacterized protein n=1 Tax=Anguilla anguilla TaxID=7936 RepID=A0A0E9Q9X8_ANGAN